MHWEKRRKMKRKTTKEILAESFRELAKIKKTDKITVKEITENCGYSPATFYRQFKDKYDLISWDYTERLNAIISKIGTDGYLWKDAVLDELIEYRDNKDYIRNLLLNTVGYDSFIYNMTKANINLLKKHILSVSGLKQLDPDIVIYIKMYCYSTVSASCAWLLGDIQCDAEHLAKLFERSVPLPLKEYLFK